MAVTVTPGSTAPVLSVTSPLMRPRKSCAEGGSCLATSSTTHRQNAISLFSLIEFLQLKKMRRVNSEAGQQTRCHAVCFQATEFARRRVIAGMLDPAHGDCKTGRSEFLDWSTWIDEPFSAPLGD